MDKNGELSLAELYSVIRGQITIWLVSRFSGDSFRKPFSLERLWDC